MGESEIYSHSLYVYKIHQMEEVHPVSPHNPHHLTDPLAVLVMFIYYNSSLWPLFCWITTTLYSFFRGPLLPLKLGWSVVDVISSHLPILHQIGILSCTEEGNSTV